MPKTCHVAVSKPNRNSVGGLERYDGKAGAKPWQAAVERLKILRVLKGAQNVPRGSLSKPNRNRLKAVESCCGGFWGFKALKGCSKRATGQFPSPIETACRA